jgi:signal transduction histidine kinase
MNHLISPAFRSTDWIFRFLEWSLICATVWLSLAEGWGDTMLTWQVVTLLLTTTGLSCIFPVNQLLWIRQSYIACGILLFLWGSLQGLVVDAFLYLYLAKSCFLFSRRQALVIAAIAGTLTIATASLSQSNWLELEMSWHSTVAQNSSFQASHPFILDASSGYLLTSLFTMIFCFTLISERKSRNRADALAQEVETLAATLERHRIAREIHDSLGHSLTTLNIHLAVAHKWYQKDANKALQALETARYLAHQCIEEVNQTLRTLRYSDFDLYQAVLALIEPMRQTHVLHLQWEIHLPQLPLQTSYHLYYLVKEGLMNIQKHAEASQVYVQGRSDSNQITIEIADDGQGFDSQLQQGFGLKGMRERTQLLGGQFTLQSAIGRGTQILISVPLQSIHTLTPHYST